MILHNENRNTSIKDDYGLLNTDQNEKIRTSANFEVLITKDIDGDFVHSFARVIAPVFLFLYIYPV